MSPLALVFIAIAAVILLLILVIKVNVPAFIALLIVSILTGLVAGVGPAEIIPLVIEGLGGTLGSVALLVGLGAMLGGIIEKTGGAEVLARYFTEKLGEKRVSPALMIASAIISIPIFFDVAFIILIPIIYSFSKAAGMKSPLPLGLPLAFMLFVHVTVPPHPGIAGSAAVTGGDVGLITLFGLLLCLPVGIVSYFVCKRITAREYPILPNTKKNYDNFGIGEDIENSGTGGATPSEGVTGGGGATVATKVNTAAKTTTLPSAGAVLFSVLLPVVLIGIGTVGGFLVDEGSTVSDILKMIGAPAFALLVSSLVALVVLGTTNGWSVKRLAEVMDHALGPAAVVVFVTGAGGVFAKVLTETGIGEAVADLMLGTGMPILLLAFILAAVLRAAQGSATVSAITTAGLLQATLAAGDYSTMQIVLLNLAIGVGAITLSHVNDSGFWIVTRYLGLSVKDGLRTWSPLVTFMGTLGFVFVSIGWLFV